MEQNRDKVAFASYLNQRWLMAIKVNWLLSEAATTGRASPLFGQCRRRLFSRHLRLFSRRVQAVQNRLRRTKRRCQRRSFRRDKPQSSPTFRLRPIQFPISMAP